MCVSPTAMPAPPTLQSCLQPVTNPWAVLALHAPVTLQTLCFIEENCRRAAEVYKQGERGSVIGIKTTGDLNNYKRSIKSSRDRTVMTVIVFTLGGIRKHVLLVLRSDALNTTI